MSIRCSLGFHKWSFESKNLPKHKREANYDSIYMYEYYGESTFYEYECGRCGKKQWYSETVNMYGYSLRKLNINEKISK